MFSLILSMSDVFPSHHPHKLGADKPVKFLNMLVPHVSDINPADSERYASLKAVFESTYNSKPDALVRAPGRVNIIGDHIDYSYYSVLPMAIECNVIIAFKVTNSPEIEVANTDSQFPYSKFKILENNHVEIDAEKLEWANYFKSGFVVATRDLAKKGEFKAKGMQVAMTGNVPAGGGLSSSAAFVVGATLATLLANGQEDVSKIHLTKLSTTCEQLLGMNTGGMDQAASIFGEVNHCLLISFKPELTAQPMEYPKLDQDFAFLVANSCVQAVKHLTAPIHYNLRVVEVSVAANLLAKKLGVQIPQDGNLQCGTLRGVMEAKLGDGVSKAKLEEMLQITEENLDQEGYTAEAAAKDLGLSSDEFTKKFLSSFPVRFEKLKLYERTKHVYAEAERVLEFVDKMKTSKSLQDFGDLMNASHESAQLLFDNSHPDVDELVTIARAAGSVGSRVTGAGWGGSTVHMVPKDKVDIVKKAIETEYYAKKYPDAPNDAMIVTIPAEGAAIVDASILDKY